jgi:hypothetical protein
LAGRVEPEKQIYYLVITVLGIALLGLPYARYLAYLLPVFVLLSAFLLRCITINITRVTIPFLMILLISIPTAYEYDVYSIKKILFISSFTSIFVFVDFSRVKINFHYYSFVLVVLFAIQIASGSLSNQGESLDYSLIDSKSSFESTLSFPFAILACFFILKGRWILSILFILFVFISLKRIAVISVLITLVAKFVPRSLRSILVNPYLIVGISLFITTVTIYFAYGQFDKEIFEIFNRSPNDFSKGRQQLWLTALKGLEYEFTDFMFYGGGVGQVVTVLTKAYGTENLLAHNDILVLYLEFGLIFLVIFLILHLHQKTYEQKVMALGLITLLFTDNVIIYQHVMITYLFTQSQFERRKESKHQHKPILNE